MQWLNKVDEALDWVLGPVPPAAEGNAGNSAAVAAGGVGAAAVGNASRRPPNDGSDADGRTAVEEDDSAKKGPSEPSAAVQHKNIAKIVGIEGGKKSDVSATTTAIIRGDSKEAGSSRQQLPPLPPPPPPPPPPRKYTATPPPPLLKKQKSPMLPPDTCPSTPMLAMAGEFLVVDESPHPASNNNNNDNNDNNDNNMMINATEKSDGCDDGSHCQPPASIFTDEKAKKSQQREEEESELLIQREAEAIIITQQREAKVAIPIRQQMQKTPLRPPQTTKQHSEVLMGKNDEGRPADVGVSAIDEAEQMEQIHAMSQMQDLVLASPAPLRVMIGDREPDRSSKLHDDDAIERLSLSDEIENPPRPPLPPPPPMMMVNDNNMNQQQTNRTTSSRNRTIEPPSPSTFIIQLPNKSDPQKGLPMPPPLFGQGGGGSSSSWATPSSTPNPVRPYHPHNNAPPRSFATTTRAMMTPNRPTPGIIRRKLREPSPSPPESPLPPFSDDEDSSSKNDDDDDDDSAFIPSNAGLDSDAEVVNTPAAPPPPGVIDTKRVHSEQFPPPPPFIQSGATMAERDGGRAEGGAGARVAKAGAKGVKFAPAPPPPPPPPPAMKCDSATPVTDNRKVAAAAVAPPPPEPQRQSRVTDGKDIGPAAPLNKVVDKALDLVLGPVLISGKDGEADVKKERKKDGVQAPVDHNKVDGDVGDGKKEEAMSDAITGWFKRMGSTDGGQLNDVAKKKNAEDDDDVGSMSDSFHSQDSNDSDLTDSEKMDDFAIPPPTFEQIQGDGSDQSWDPSVNRYGFFHVRLLRSQRLPCASGSSVSATLSLQPWKGRIHIPAHTTVDGPEGAGVCLRWDKPSLQTKGKSKGGRKGGSKDDKPPQEGHCSHSMVHAYNNEDTPVPTILLELSIASLGASLGGVFDRFLCSISIPCHALLRNPRVWTHRWYPASLVEGEQLGDEDTMRNAPFILLESCFEPKNTRATVSTLSNQIVLEQETKSTEEEPFISEDSDTLGSIPQIIRPDRLQDDESLSKSSTLTPAIIPRSTNVTKSHLMRVRSFWTPTWCAVCSKNITTGWMQGKNFECEACHIFCCQDCQLQVDARIPCGSELATIAVEKAKQYQVPSLSRVMTTLAPHLDVSKALENTPDRNDANDPSIVPSTVGRANLNALQGAGKSIDGIGILSIRVSRASLFDKTLPWETEPKDVFESDSNLRHGDHYVRISWLGSKESKRTKTVLQTSKPLFDSEEMVFDVPHYGMEYKLEVVDANTDRPVGTCLLSAQGLLQWQRDEMLATKDRMLLSFFHLRKYSEPRRTKVELRTGVKDGFGLNFYNSSKVAAGPKGKETSARPGEISGWLELDVHLEEDRQLFYSPQPRQCPPRTEEEFDIALIQLHIARIGEIIAGIQKLVSTYLYVVSWENIKVTGASLITFVVLTLRFNLEYLGALPVGCLVLYMANLAYLRLNGHFKDRWTMKEKDALIESETKIKQNQSIFRPVGLLQVGNLQGKHLRSRELGLPGSFYASISYDPMRYADEKMKSSMVKVDSISGCTHEVGATVSPGITTSPIWTSMHESPELMRLKHLLPGDRLWRHENNVDASLSYPILQPITEDMGFSPEEVDGAHRTGVQLMPWDRSLGAVVIQVRFSDVLGSFQMFDNVLGEVVIPLAKLAASGRSVEGWFLLLDVGTKETLPGESSNDAALESGAKGEEEEDATPAAVFPELHLRVQFSPSTANFGGISLSDDMESSKVICEELSRTASIAQENSGIGVIGSSLNTINTVRSLGGQLQNQISFVVDMLERGRNAFNFSNPRITVFILLCLIVLWVVLALIPTRLVVLVAGLGQYGATFYTQFMAPPPKKNRPKETSEGGVESINKGNPLENLFLSIPTDEDLRRTYFWEARRLGEKEREKFAVSKRQSRLQKLWKAKWHGTLELKEKKSGHPSSPSSSRNWDWETAFALVEGHRFIWWRSEKHFDTGEAPLGQIFFAGHSGLAGLSPLDLRELSKDEIPYVVSIFGRGSQEQLKITLLAPSSNVKESLENAVLDASMDAKAD